MMEEAYLDDINPVRGDFRVVVKIDKSFSREPIHFNAYCSSKEFECVDFVVYDRKGTRMLVQLRTLESRARFLWMLSPGAVYEMFSPEVEENGLGVHERFHLCMTRRSNLADAVAQFPPLPLNLKSPDQVPRSYERSEGFLDVVGFVKYCGFVHWGTSSGYMEKELFLVLQSVQAGPSGPLPRVRCVLIGSWVEQVKKEVEMAMNATAYQFVLLRYVMSAQPIGEAHILRGMRSVVSYTNATTFDVDPPISAVQQFKQNMLTKS